MAEAPLNRYARKLGRHRPEVARRLRIARRSKAGARIATSVMRARLRRAQFDPDGDEPFSDMIDDDALGGRGARIGSVPDGRALIWREAEIPYSALVTGDPGYGKTELALGLINQLAGRYPIIIPDIRGDYEPLVRHVSNSRYLPFGEFPVNLLRAPAGVAQAIFNQRFTEAFVDSFGLQQSSGRYLIKTLDALEDRRRQHGHGYCLPDLRDALQARQEPRGSDELRFRNRCLARTDALCRALGERFVGVEQGVDLAELIAANALIVLRSDVEKSISDFLTHWAITYAFALRSAAEDKFNQAPLIIVLDEQRSILRATGPARSRISSCC